jgi:3-hydroxyacyl-CoA dehydrogenase
LAENGGQREAGWDEIRRYLTMQVTVIGAGNMGRGIGHRLVAGGHSVVVVDRDPEEAEELRGEDRRLMRAGGRTGGNMRHSKGGQP